MAFFPGQSLPSLLQGLVVEGRELLSQVADFGPYRPPQWANPNFSKTTLTMNVTETVQVAPGSTPTFSGSFGLPSAPPLTQQQTTTYVFDAIIRAEHHLESEITRNPVQISGVVSDHAYNLPSVVEVEIKMSDAMQSFTSGQFSGGASRSVDAFHALRDLKQNHTPVGLATRMNQYDTMLIQSIRVIEDKESRHGAKMLVRFQELLLAPVELTNSALVGAAKTVSARPQTTDSTVKGLIGTQPIPQALTNQHNISGIVGLPKIPGAGNWSSTNVSALTGLFS